MFQRAAAVGSSPLPVLIQPAIYMAIAVAVAVASTSIVLSSRWRTGVPVLARFACLAALLCSPAVNETYASLVNTHWWLGLGLILMGLLNDPVNRRTRVAEIAFVVVSSLSGLAALYGLPSLAVRAARERSRHAVVLVVVAASGLLAQIATLAVSARRGDVGLITSDAATVVLVLIKRVFATAALGPTPLTVLWPRYETLPWVWIFAIALLAAFVVIWARSRSLEHLALLLTLLGGWLLALFAQTQPETTIDQLMTWPNSASRFFVAPIAAMVISVIVGVNHGSVSRVAEGVVVLLLTIGIVSGYALSPLQPVDWAPFAECVERALSICSTTIAPDWPLEIVPPSAGPGS